MSVMLSEAELAARGPRIQRLLSRISGASSGPAWKRILLASGVIIGAHDGSTGREYRDWRFRTLKPEYFGSYFERWLPNATGTAFNLERAYLHVFYRDRATETAYVAVHCDPEEPPASPHYQYKRGPHIHVSVAPQPLPHAHIALGEAHFDLDLASAEALTAALESAVQMLRSQVLDHL